MGEDLAMSEFVAPVNSVPAVGASRPIPRIVRVAFWLWSPLIVGEAALLVYMVVSMPPFLEVAPDYLLVLFPFSVLLLALLGAQIPLLFRMRRGRRVARGWLLGLVIFTALVAAWQVVSAIWIYWGMVDPGTMTILLAVSTVIVVVVLLALAGAILPFRRSVKPYFAGSAAAAGGSPTV